ncbi:MAG: PAS domain S-box protein [Planctomycetes bacterium]|nr:PAS domain S-box protein [Planctomycetota bacterium]
MKFAEASKLKKFKRLFLDYWGQYKSIARLFIIILLVIFLCEVVIMVLLHAFGISSHWGIFLDPVSLALMSTPLLYLFVIEPMQNIIAQLRQTQTKLKIESATMEAADNIVVITDERGNIVQVNKAFTYATGYEQKEVIGKNPRILQSGKTDQKLYVDLWMTITSGQTWRGVFINKRKDETLYHEEATITPVKDDYDEIKFFIKVAQDITKRIETENALKRSENKTRTLLQASPIGILAIDKEGNIVFTNPAIEKMFGYQENELINNKIEMLLLEKLHSKHVGHREKYFLKLEQKFLHSEGNLHGKCKDGTLMPVEIGVSWAETEAGMIAVAFVTDITQRIEAMEELKLTHDQLVLESHRTGMAEAANIAKIEFLANMSHELRTPLHSILSFANFGTKKINTTTPEKLLGYFEKITLSGKTLQELVDNLFDLSMFETKSTEFEFAPARLDELITSVLEKFDDEIKRQSLSINFNPEEFTEEVTLDSEKIKRLIRNLLTNAIRYSPEKGTIDIKMSKIEESVMVSVHDQSDGIPPEELETIFDMFVQSSKTKSGAGGTGLGLTICRNIVAEHNGLIWAENAKNGGAIFQFKIPIVQQPTKEIPQTAHAVQSGDLET